MSFNKRDANIDVDGNYLFAKIHGFSADVTAGSTHIFTFDVPYTLAYFSGTEICYDVKSQADLNVEVYNPETEGFVPYQQFGFNVCQGEMYKKECSYAAKVQLGVRLKCTVTNYDSVTKKMGVNFHLHEAVKL